MEGQDDEPSAGVQAVKCGIQTLRKLIQLAVDGDTQRLKDPLGRVSALTAGSGRDGRIDEIDQLAGMGKGFFLPLGGYFFAMG